MARIQQIKVIRRLQGFDDAGLVELAVGLGLQPGKDQQSLIFQISRAVSAAGEWPSILPAPPPVRNIKPKPIRGESKRLRADARQYKVAKRNKLVRPRLKPKRKVICHQLVREVTPTPPTPDVVIVQQFSAMRRKHAERYHRIKRRMSRYTALRSEDFQMHVPRRRRHFVVCDFPTYRPCH